MYPFFLRHNNDVDHLVPVAWKMYQCGYHVEVFLWQGHRIGGIEDDYRLQFLLDCGVPVHNKAYDEDFIENNNPKALVFDWMSSNKNAAMCNKAYHAGIPTIALPHGMYIFTNRFERGHLGSKYKHYDWLISNGDFFREHMIGKGRPEDRTIVIGSARYCDEWMKIHQDLYPRMMPEESYKNNKMKIVIFASAIHWGVFPGKFANTIINLDIKLKSLLRNSELIIKPHTRTKSKIDKIARISYGDQYWTSELIDWADVVCIISSSVIAEALLKDKICIYLQYVHKNSMEFDDFGACHSVGSSHELLETLVEIQNGTWEKTYTQENVDKWITEAVYGGDRNKDVLQEYVDFIVNAKPSPTRTKF